MMDKVFERGIYIPESEFRSLEQEEGVIKDATLIGRLKLITEGKSLNDVIGFDNKGSDFFLKLRIKTQFATYFKKINGGNYHTFLERMGVKGFEDLVGKKVTCYTNNPL